MRDEIAVALVDALDDLATGYKECAQRIYAAEYVLLDEPGIGGLTKINKAYLQMKARVIAGEPGLGLETERWNELAKRVELTLTRAGKELSQGY